MAYLLCGSGLYIDQPSPNVKTTATLNELPGATVVDCGMSSRRSSALAGVAIAPADRHTQRARQAIRRE